MHGKGLVTACASSSWIMDPYFRLAKFSFGEDIVGKFKNNTRELKNVITKVS